MHTIAVLGTLDTKGAEHAFVADCIRKLGHRALLIDVGSQHAATLQPDISREQVLQAAKASPDTSSISIDPLPNDRGQAIAMMGPAAAALLRKLLAESAVQGVISLGGTGGTSIATAAMRALPLGFPKVMVSTVAGGDNARYVGVSDIVMVPSIVDVSGLNRISIGVFARAAAMVCAMADANAHAVVPSDTKPLIVASMFGNTTPCVERARQQLEQAGYEVLVFHATGTGGRTMEALIESGNIAGVLDITTTEWADELVGGVMGGGPTRLEAAARRGVPAIVTPGCLDMVNFGARSSVPERFQHRNLYQHNPQITLMRTTPDECSQLGRILAEKLNLSVGKACFLYPLKAISLISAAGHPFHDPAADQALYKSLKQHLRPDIPLIEVDCEINDPLFADHCVRHLLDAIQQSNQT